MDYQFGCDFGTCCTCNNLVKPGHSSAVLRPKNRCTNLLFTIILRLLLAVVKVPYRRDGKEAGGEQLVLALLIQDLYTLKYLS